MVTKLEILIEAQNRTSAEVKKITRDFRALDTQLKKNVLTTNANTTANARLTTSFQSATTAGQGLARVLLLFGGIALFAGAIRSIVQFEQSMANVRAVVIDVNDAAEIQEAQFKALGDEARRLGATTVFSATQAAEGLEFLGRAGFTAEEAIGALEGTLNLAAAGSLDLGTAADIASNVLSGFALATSEAGRVADVLAEAAASSNTNVRQLGEAIRFVGPVAAAFGISIEDTAAALGVLGNAGLQASTAGTGLRRVLGVLGVQSNKLTGLLNKLGLEFNDVNPATNDLTDIIDLLAASSISAADALEVFGQRGAPAILAIASQSDELRRLNQSLLDATDGIGRAAQIAAVQTNTLAGAFKLLVSAIQETLIAAGDSGLRGALRSLIDTIAGVVRTLNGTQSALDENAVLFRQIADAVESLRFILFALIGVRVLGFLGGFRAGLINLRGAIGTATIGLTGLARAAAATRTVFLTALGPLGWIIGIGLALVDFARNDAQEAIDALKKVEQAVSDVDETVAGFRAADINVRTVQSEQNLEQLNEQLEATNDLLAQAANAQQSAAFDELEVPSAAPDIDVGETEARREALLEAVAIEQAKFDRLKELGERATADETAALKKQIEALAKLEGEAVTAELDAERARLALIAEQELKRLELAKATADEEAKIRTAALDTQLEESTITVEAYYEGLQELALRNTEAELAILRQKIATQNALNQQQIADLTQQAVLTLT